MTNVPDLPLVGVGVVVIRDGQMLLVKRGRDPGKGLWAVPGGKVRLGESLKDTARREVEEETNLQVEVRNVVWVGELIDDNNHIVLIDFAGEVVAGELEASDDADEARWVSLETIDQLPLTATMYDLISTLTP